MAAVVECGCGELLEAEAEGHVETVHPELIGTLSPLELADRSVATGAV